MISFNQVTWYSKLAAVILFVAIWLIGIYIGSRLQYLAPQVPLQQVVSREEKPTFTYSIDPTIKQINTPNDLSNFNELTGSTYRVIIRNTEFDPCISIDEVTVRYDNEPTVLKTQKFCSVEIGGTVTSLTEDVPFVGYENIAWKNGGITFDLDLSRSELLSCVIDDVEQAVTMGNTEGAAIVCSYKSDLN